MKCSFSGQEIPTGTGKMYVKKDGTILWFSSQKAQKNMLKLKRKANKVRWTEDARLAKQARLATLEHEEEKIKEDSDSKPADEPSKSSKKPSTKSLKNSAKKSKK